MINQAAINLIKHFEGLHDGDLSAIGLQPKQCPAGVWTVGYGHALRGANGQFLKTIGEKKQAYQQYKALTEPQAESLLQQDIALFERYIEGMLRVKVNENQRGALVSICYNIGATALKNSTLMQKLNNGDYQGASDGFLAWNKSKGIPLKGLINRRAAERKLFNANPS